MGNGNSAEGDELIVEDILKRFCEVKSNDDLLFWEYLDIPDTEGSTKKAPFIVFQDRDMKRGLLLHGQQVFSLDFTHNTTIYGFKLGLIVFPDNSRHGLIGGVVITPLLSKERMKSQSFLNS